MWTSYFNLTPTILTDRQTCDIKHINNLLLQSRTEEEEEEEKYKIIGVVDHQKNKRSIENRLSWKIDQEGEGYLKSIHRERCSRHHFRLLKNQLIDKRRINKSSEKKAKVVKNKFVGSYTIQRRWGILKEIWPTVRNRSKSGTSYNWLY